MELSIAIIVCKRDAAGTEKTVQSLFGLDADIFLYDTSNEDISAQQAAKYNIRLCKGAWEGYEQVRFKAAMKAKHDWILMLHTGEELDEKLRHSLQQLDYSNIRIAYRIGFINFFANKWLRHGAWGSYSPVRLANRGMVTVPGGRVNESIFSGQEIRIRKLKGHILHSSFRDRNGLAKKVIRDALLAAARYYREGRRVYLINMIVSPVIAFLQNYFFKLGFLDGANGYICARMGARYTFMKYARLRELKRTVRKRP